MSNSLGDGRHVNHNTIRVDYNHCDRKRFLEESENPREANTACFPVNTV